MQTEIVYDSSHRKPPAIEELINAFAYKDLILQLVRRDITARYKRSVLGIAWTMLHPLGIMIILTVVFSNLFHRQQYFSVYLLTGLLIWNFFSQSSVAIIKNLVRGEDLFQRIYLPRSSFAIAAIGTGIVNLILSLVPLLLVKLFIGSPLSWQIVFLPIYVLYAAAFSLGIGLIIACLALFFHDIAEMYEVLLTGWFYLTPIVYPMDMLPQNIRSLLSLNPVLHIVELMRDSFYYNKTPTLQEFLIVGAFSFTILVIGWLFFARQTEEFVMKA